MRTTLDIDDDLLQAAKELARRERKSAGRVVSELMRQALTGQANATRTSSAANAVNESAEVYGLRPLPANGRVVTNEEVKRLRDELGI